MAQMDFKNKTGSDKSMVLRGEDQGTVKNSQELW
jgi:hypothetical protein